MVNECYRDVTTATHRITFGLPGTRELAEELGRLSHPEVSEPFAEVCRPNENEDTEPMFSEPRGG